jgi:PadR family transcriptional regulator PadR
MGKPSDLIQGTLDLLILKTVALEPKHGWAIAKRIQQISNDVLQVTQGALYPALHRLEQQGWLKAQAGQTQTGREAKFYALTAAGRKQLVKELEQWDRLSSAVGLIVREVE